ncbi:MULTISPECIES: hypothetical protein [unclassified Streptomyces]|uniref:hypothetical protein n=1 Tax=unclassified Streptomyces TaxID=2593676 RepID=UPI0004BDF1E2|nr:MULTISPECIES: hypothetical protein [unclassified Streptomyces]
MPFEGFDEVSNTIIEYLTAAGWDRTTRSVESEVPEFVSSNGQMRTSIFQHLSDKSLTLTLIDIQSGGYRRFEVRYGDSIHSLLGILAAWHQHITPENFGIMVNEIAKEIPELLAEPQDGDVDTPWERVTPQA